MNYPKDDSPNFEGRSWGRRHEAQGLWQNSYCEIAVEQGNNCVAVTGFDGAVYDQDVAGANGGVIEYIAFYMHEEGIVGPHD